MAVVIEDAKASPSAPPRRTTNRTRKVPSRLLPSPSPPPSRPSSYGSVSKAQKPAQQHAVSTPTQQTRSKKGGKASASPPPAQPAVDALSVKSKSTSNIFTSKENLTPKDEEDQGEELGLGKRKRRPSTMYKPPSTLTSASSEVTTPSLHVSRPKKKSISPCPEGAGTEIAEASESPLAQHARRTANAGGKGKPRTARVSSGSARKIINSLEPVSEKEKESAANNNSQGAAYESDGGVGVQDVPDSDAEFEDGFDGHVGHARLATRPGQRATFRKGSDSKVGAELPPPPLLPRGAVASIEVPADLLQPTTFTKGGHVSQSPESASSKRMRLGLKASGQRFGEPLSPETPLAKKGHNAHLDSKKRLPASLHSLLGHTRTKSAPNFERSDACVMFATKSVRSPFGVSSLHHTSAPPTNLEDSENEDEEDDFHKAMLDGVEFDTFDGPRSEGAKGSLWNGKQGNSSSGNVSDDAEAEDTPATTPRSPQSGCELPIASALDLERAENRRGKESNGFADISAKTSEKSRSRSHPPARSRDSVFAHALPTSVVSHDRPNQHAGSLTLSLPYSPDEVAESGSPRLGGADSQASILDERFSTPIVERRHHIRVDNQSLCANGVPDSIKLESSEGLGISQSSTTNPLLGLSSRLDIGSPLLSPSHALGQVSQPPSPFVMGIGADVGADLDHPVPLLLPPSQPIPAPGPTTTGVVSHHEDKDAVARRLEFKVEEDQNLEGATKATQISSRHISFNMRKPVSSSTWSSQPGAGTGSKSGGPGDGASSVLDKLASKGVEPWTRDVAQSLRDDGSDPWIERTSTPDMSSAMTSPFRDTDCEVEGENDGENLLFGPPETVGLQELDQAWGGDGDSAEDEILAFSKEAAAKATPIPTVCSSVTPPSSVSPTPPPAPGSLDLKSKRGPEQQEVVTTKRKAKITRLDHVDVTGTRRF
ncbi:hypothetical protein IE53DRAFT_368868 [Violaceomyces palustris]|uniref:Uncharacterized protein n=1 Tax=Violaceomyces palustris TaxID=1673888 RepID=A0ACD0NXA5_9BASI|nr:hypothetical protein IE53DRAFT_368868 [Violaceomyces palustris]